MMSLWVPQAISAAAELGLADALGERAASAAELSSQLGTHPDATARLLQALAVLGIVVPDEQRFRLTALGNCLRSDASNSRRAWARLMGGAAVWRAWGQLADCVRRGEPAYAAGDGPRSSETETFDAFFGDAEGAAVFHQAMADGTRGMAADIVAAAELRDARSIVDIGGGFGELLCTALQVAAHAHGQVFDLEHARDGALALFAKRGLGARAGFVSGDLFAGPPPQAELLLLKSVIHDWNDARSLRILRHCRDAMRDGARLIVVEPCAAAPGTPVAPDFAWVVAFSDLNMLVNCGGRERTEREYVALLERADLRVTAVRPTASGFYSCFECVR